MNSTVKAISVLAVCLLIAANESQAEPGTPAQQYAALMKEYRPVSSGMRSAKTDLQRKVAVERIGTYPAKFVELAEKYPQDPIALVALKQAVQALCTTDSAAQITWETNRSNFPVGIMDGSAAKTVAFMLRYYVNSEKIGPVCDRMRFSYRLENMAFLQAVLRTNPHRNVQAVASISLALFLKDRLRMLQLVQERPDLTKRFEIVFGKNYLSELRRLGRDELTRRIETLLELATKYDDVKTRSGRTIADQAKIELYEIRHLSIGKIAPDIEGKDQDGKRLKLSDYRGKVVLLYFWMEF